MGSPSLTGALVQAVLDMSPRVSVLHLATGGGKSRMKVRRHERPFTQWTAPKKEIVAYFIETEGQGGRLFSFPLLSLPPRSLTAALA